MATYAIGDIQGCFDQFQALLKHIQFDPSKDKLWLTGDLINRGPGSLKTLRYVKDLGDRAVSVLGNHECHFLAVAQGHKRAHRSDTFDEILYAPDSSELIEWVRQLPFFHRDDELGYAMLHAGVPPQWSEADIQERADELSAALQDHRFDDFLSEMYGNKPNRWSKDLTGHDRLRFIINCFTRMRFCTPDGKLELKQKGALNSQPEPLVPWFQAPDRLSRELPIIFGHWSQLGFYQGDNVVCLDSGCLWGGSLTALELETGENYSLSCDCILEPKSKA